MIYKEDIMPMTRRRDPRLELLSQVELFRGCPKRELAVIAGLTTPAEVRDGTVLCRQGEAGREAFVIIDGEASVTIDAVEVARLGPGTFCCEMALLENGARSATVIASSPMTLLALSASEFDRLVRDAPTVTHRMLVALSSRLRNASMTCR
jgi:CRP/FNR family transcriptional regulator, cyclic AMP receptor protein